ncbi:MAG: hypothetical protein Q8P67_12195, partial [archaeon]|nr:hypothetical protein [archaeon]
MEPQLSAGSRESPTSVNPNLDQHGANVAISLQIPASLPTSLPTSLLGPLPISPAPFRGELALHNGLFVIAPRTASHQQQQHYQSPFHSPDGSSELGPRRKRSLKLVVNCPHTSKPHYSKGYCRSCYNHLWHKCKVHKRSHPSTDPAAPVDLTSGYLKKFTVIDPDSLEPDDLDRLTDAFSHPPIPSPAASSPSPSPSLATPVAPSASPFLAEPQLATRCPHDTEP